MKAAVRSYRQVLLACLAYAYLAAVSYIVILPPFLPAGDLARKKGLLLLADPFIQTGLVFVSLAVGLLGSPLVWWRLRSARLVACGAVCLAATLVEFLAVHARPVPSVAGGAAVSLMTAFLLSLLPIFSPRAATRE